VPLLLLINLINYFTHDKLLLHAQNAAKLQPTTQ